MTHMYTSHKIIYNIQIFPWLYCWSSRKIQTNFDVITQKKRFTFLAVKYILYKNSTFPKNFYDLKFSVAAYSPLGPQFVALSKVAQIALDRTDTRLLRVIALHTAMYRRVSRTKWPHVGAHDKIRRVNPKNF